MEPADKVAIDGLKIVSPCRICYIHLIGLPKKSTFCKGCKTREKYDEMVEAGITEHPFIPAEVMEKYGMFV